MLGLSDNADYFPAEAGREPLLTGTGPRGVSVWPTNSLRNTGGYLGHEILPHTESKSLSFKSDQAMLPPNAYKLHAQSSYRPAKTMMLPHA